MTENVAGEGFPRECSELDHDRPLLADSATSKPVARDVGVTGGRRLFRDVREDCYWHPKFAKGKMSYSPSQFGKRVGTVRRGNNPDARTLLSLRGPQVTQPLVLSMIAALSTAFGVAECHADVLRGQPLPFGPRRENFFDGLLAAAILIAFPLNFFWIWESWPWYVALGCVPVLYIGSRLLVTRTTIARWVKFRPAVAIGASLAASILWVIFPPS